MEIREQFGPVCVAKEGLTLELVTQFKSVSIVTATILARPEFRATRCEVDRSHPNKIRVFCLDLDGVNCAGTVEGSVIGKAGSTLCESVNRSDSELEEFIRRAVSMDIRYSGRIAKAIKDLLKKEGGIK